MDILVYEIPLTVKLNNNIYLSDIHKYIGKMIAKTIYHENSSIKEEHYKHKYKDYIFSNLGYVKDRNYKQKRKYTLTLRTINPMVIGNMLKSYKDEYGEIIKGDNVKVTLFNSNNKIKAVFPVNPVILVKPDKTYFSPDSDEIDVAIKLLNDNAEKKVKQFLNIDLKIDFIESIRILNEYPIVINYKNNKFLGNKFLIIPKMDEESQLAAKLLYGIGLGNKNASLGAGFFNIGA